MVHVPSSTGSTPLTAISCLVASRALVKAEYCRSSSGSLLHSGPSPWSWRWGEKGERVWHHVQHSQGNLWKCSINQDKINICIVILQCYRIKILIQNISIFQFCACMRGVASCVTSTVCWMMCVIANSHKLRPLSSSRERSMYIPHCWRVPSLSC